MVGASDFFFVKTYNQTVVFGFDDSELNSLLFFDWNSRDGGLRATLDMELHHLANVHAIDMIRAEDGHHVRLGLFDEVHVLIDGVRGAAIPVLILRSHLSGNGNDEVVPKQAGRFPALAEVLQQGLALELNQHVDGIDAGVDQVAQDKVDDAVAATKGDGGFGALLGERI